MSLEQPGSSGVRYASLNNATRVTVGGPSFIRGPSVIQVFGGSRSESRPPAQVGIVCGEKDGITLPKGWFCIELDRGLIKNIQRSLCKILQGSCKIFDISYVIF